MSAVWDLLPSSKSASSTTWARPPDLLAPSSCASSTQSGVGGAYDVTVDNLDAFLFAVLHTVPDCTSRLQFPGLKARTVNSITRAFKNAGNNQPSALVSKGRSSGNNFGKVLRNFALGLRIQQQPAVNSTEGLKNLESMLHMLTSVYGAITEFVPQSQTSSWASAFLDGMRYQLGRVLGILMEYLKTSNTPKRFWGYQQLTRRLIQRPNPERTLLRPTDEGVFNFLVLIVWSWHVVSRGYESGYSPTGRTQSEHQPARNWMQNAAASPRPDSARKAGASTTTQLSDTPKLPAATSPHVTEEFQAVQTLLQEFFSRCTESTAMLTLLLDTGRQRYTSTPERGTTPSPTPPQALTYTPFGRKMLQYSFMGSSTPASGGWLHGLRNSVRSGASQDLSENGDSSAVQSLELAAGTRAAWALSSADDSSGMEPSSVSQDVRNVSTPATSGMNAPYPSSTTSLSPESSSYSYPPVSPSSSSRSARWKSMLVRPFLRSNNRRKLGPGGTRGSPFDDPDLSSIVHGFGPTAQDPVQQGFGYQNSGNASSTISLPDPQGSSQSVGLSTSRQLLSGVNPVASSSLGGKSSGGKSSGGTSQLNREMQSLNHWLRSGAEQHSSGDTSTPISSTPLERINELAGEGFASRLDSKYLKAHQEGTETLTLDLAAAAAPTAGTTSTPDSGPIFPSTAPIAGASSAATLPKLQTGSNSAGTLTRGESVSSPVSPRSPESARRREVVEAAFAPYRPSPKSPRGSGGRDFLVTVSPPASPTRISSRSLSSSRSPSGGQFAMTSPLSGGAQPRSSRIDRSLRGHSLPRSNIPSSPSRANTSALQTGSSHSDTLLSISLRQSPPRPSAIPASPHKTPQRLNKSLPRNAFSSSRPEDASGRELASQTARSASARSATPKKAAPKARTHSMSPRKSMTKGAGTTNLSSGASGSIVQAAVPLHGTKQWDTSGCSEQQDKTLLRDASPQRVGKGSSGGNRHVFSSQEPSTPVANPGVNVQAAAKEGLEVANTSKVAVRTPLAPSNTGIAPKSAGGSESDDTSRDLFLVRNVYRQHLCSGGLASSAQAPSASNKTSSAASTSAPLKPHKLNLPDAELALERNFSSRRREDPRSPTSPSVAARVSTGMLLDRNQADSSGALSEAESRAWEDNGMASQKLLVAPPGMTLAPANIAMRDRSSFVSGNIDSHTVRGPRTFSPRKSISAPFTELSTNLDHGAGEQDDADSAAMHGILTLGSTVGFMSDDFSSGVVDEQPWPPAQQSRATTQDLNNKKKEKTAKLTTGEEVSVFETPPSPQPQTSLSGAVSATTPNGCDTEGYASAVSDSQSAVTATCFGTPTSELVAESSGTPTKSSATGNQSMQQYRLQSPGAEEPWQAALETMKEEERRGSAAVAGLSDVADKLQRDVAEETSHTQTRRVSALAGLEEVPTLTMLADGMHLEAGMHVSEAGAEIRSGLSGASDLAGTEPRQTRDVPLGQQGSNRWHASDTLEAVSSWRDTKQVFPADTESAGSNAVASCDEEGFITARTPGDEEAREGVEQEQQFVALPEDVPEQGVCPAVGKAASSAAGDVDKQVIEPSRAAESAGGAVRGTNRQDSVGFLYPAGSLFGTLLAQAEVAHGTAITGPAVVSQEATDQDTDDTEKSQLEPRTEEHLGATSTEGHGTGAGDPGTSSAGLGAESSGQHAAEAEPAELSCVQGGSEDVPQDASNISGELSDGKHKHDLQQQTDSSCSDKAGEAGTGAARCSKIGAQKEEFCSAESDAAADVISHPVRVTQPSFEGELQVLGMYVGADLPVIDVSNQVHM